MLKDRFKNLLKLEAEGGSGGGNDSNNSGGTEGGESNKGGSEGGSGGSEGGSEGNSKGAEDNAKQLEDAKKEGMKELLEKLGIDEGDEDTIEKVKKHLDSEKTNGEKLESEKKKNETKLQSAERELQVLKINNLLLKNGINAKYSDDATTLLIAGLKKDEKVTDEKIKEFKEKHTSWFSESEEEDPGKKGTGNSTNGGKKKKDGEESLGVRLAKKSTETKAKKSYWGK